MPPLESPSKLRARHKTGRGFPRLGRLGSRAGQGMIEYILVVVVTIIIITTLTTMLYKPLGVFIETLMGSYTACLLETGDLPALGADDVSGECKAPNFSDIAADAKPTTLPDSNKKGGSDADADKVKTPPRQSRRTSSDSPSANNRRPLIVGQGPKASAEGDAGSSKRTDLGTAATETNGYTSSGGGGSIYRRQTKYIAVSGEFAEEVKKRQERENGKTTTTPADNEGGVSLSKKKFAVVPPPMKEAKDDDNVSRLDIGQIIKYLLIAGIIIVLLVLIGGQALQLSKSWEKGGE